MAETPAEFGQGTTQGCMFCLTGQLLSSTIAGTTAGIPSKVLAHSALALVAEETEGLVLNPGKPGNGSLSRPLLAMASSATAAPCANEPNTAATVLLAALSHQLLVVALPKSATPLGLDSRKQTAEVLQSTG